MSACGWVLLTVALMVPVVGFGWLLWIGRHDKINPRVPYPPHEIMVARHCAVPIRDRYLNP